MDKSVFEQGAEKPSKKNCLRLGHRGRARFYGIRQIHQPHHGNNTQNKIIRGKLKTPLYVRMQQFNMLWFLLFNGVKETNSRFTEVWNSEWFRLKSFIWHHNRVNSGSIGRLKLRCKQKLRRKIRLLQQYRGEESLEK